MSQFGIDFTGQNPNFHRFESFNDEVVRLIRAHKEAGTVVIVDRGYSLNTDATCIVRDPINLTGTNPLVGPNDDAAGTRFPPVTNIYITQDQEHGPFQQVTVAGLKQGVVPYPDELETIKSVGADGWCYNLVPAMIVAAHAGLKV